MILLIRAKTWRALRKGLELQGEIQMSLGWYRASCMV
jgi:hypothetical protein